MRQFQIKVIAHQLKGQVIAAFGEIVDEALLNGNADELVKAGFVDELKAEDVFDLNNLTKKQLVSYAESMGLEVDEKAKNAELIKLIEEKIQENIEALND